MLTRRRFCAAGVMTALSACARDPLEAPINPVHGADPRLTPLPSYYGAMTDEPYPVPAVPEGVVHPRLRRQFVANPYPEEAPGTLIVDPDQGYLHLVQADGQALRYGAGTGREAFSWSGIARLQFTRKWPRWRVPATMIERHPELEPYSVENGGMDPGPGNPLGARALYLFQNGADTLYRIHGACEPQYLGQMVSSGCVRMLDHDVIDLYERVEQGARVVVLPSVRNNVGPVY